MARSVRRSAAAPRVCVALLSNLKAHRDKLRGVLAYGRARGWRVDLADGTAFSVRLDRAADAAAYDGFVVSRDSMLPPGWRRPGLPVVSLDAWLPGDPGPDVVCDADAVGALAARTLAAAGARAFAFLPMLALPETYAEERRRAFEAALRALGAPPPAVFRPARWGAWREEEPRLAAFLRALPRPAALFAANDIMGRFAVETALAAGLRVPEDLAVLGVDDDRDECLAASPPLSSIAIGFERAGRLAAALLERRMDGARRTAGAPAAPVTPPTAWCDGAACRRRAARRRRRGRPTRASNGRGGSSSGGRAIRRCESPTSRGRWASPRGGRRFSSGRPGSASAARSATRASAPSGNGWSGPRNRSPASRKRAASAPSSTSRACSTGTSA